MRKGLSVTPAMGATKKALGRSKGPMRIGTRSKKGRWLAPGSRGRVTGKACARGGQGAVR